MSLTCLVLSLFVVSCIGWSTPMVYVREYCGKTVYLNSHSTYISLCKVGGDVQTQCDITAITSEKGDKLLVKLVKSNIDKPEEWIEVLDGTGTQQRNIMPVSDSFKPESRGLVSSGNNLTLRFNFQSSAYDSLSNNRYLKWELLITRFRDGMTREQCEGKRSRHKRGGGYWKKHKKDDDDDDSSSEEHHWKRKYHDKDDDDEDRKDHKQKDKPVHCDRHRCMHHELRCDGHHNCDDHRDEKDCHHGKKKWMCVVIAVTVIAVVLFVIVGIVIWRRKVRARKSTSEETSETDEKVEPSGDAASDEKPPIDPATIVEAGAEGAAIPGAPQVVWSGDLPPKYPDEKGLDKDSNAEGTQTEAPATPPPEYQSRPASEKDFPIV